ISTQLLQQNTTSHYCNSHTTTYPNHYASYQSIFNPIHSLRAIDRAPTEKEEAAKTTNALISQKPNHSSKKIESILTHN
ncbi:Uncharacterized protein APZ42_009670, partial [Daphnia magna]